MDDEECSLDMQMCLEDGKDIKEEIHQEEVEEEVVMHITGDGEQVMEMAPDQSNASKPSYNTTEVKDTIIDHGEIDEAGRIEETEVVVEIDAGSETKIQKKKERKSFPCQKCGLVSSSSANLKKHMMTHTGEKPFKCRSCFKSFRQQHHLVDHWRIHSGERPFKCDVCGKHFVQKSSLNLHKKKHLSTKPYNCKECDYGTYQKTHLRIHMRTHTGEKPYQCEKCGQTFSNSTRLKYHHMIHTGERRFKCEQCGVPFREKVTLQAHMAVHLNVGPFVCEECGQEFPRLAGLSLHRRVHSNKDNYLYVHDKEANRSFNSALQKASSKVNPLKRKRAQESRKASCFKGAEDSDTDEGGEGDEPMGITSDMIGQTITSKGHQAPAISVKAPDTFMLSLSPEDKAAPGSKLSLCPNNNDQDKLKEDLATSLEHNVQNSDIDINPDQVREALRKGTVLETHSDNGKGFFIVLPPSLQNKDIMVLSEPSESTTTAAIHIPDSGGTLVDRTVSPNILSESVLETDKIPYLSVEEEVEDCDIDSAGMEEEDCSEDEEGIVLPCEAESAESILNTSDPEEVLESLGRYSEAVEERLHPDGTSLLLWKDNSGSKVTKVIYIMEEGKEPIVVEEECTARLKDDLPSGKAKKQTLKGSENVLKKSEKSNNMEPGKYIKIAKNSRITSSKARRVFTCDQCGKTCKTSSNYIAHLRIHSGERPFYCAFCKVGFKQISHLKSHIRIHTGEKPYACNLCNSTFTQSSGLRAHKKVMHPTGQMEVKEKKKKYVPEKRIKNFFCRYCNKTFIGECLKIDHMKLHQPLFPFMCKICGMQSKTKSTMLNHILKHSDFKHICELCGIELLSIEELQKHKVADHGISVLNSDMVDMYINVKVGDEKDFVILNPAVKGDKGNEQAAHIKVEIPKDSDPGFCEVKQEIIHVTDVNGAVKSEILEAPSSHDDDEVAIHDITHTPVEHDKSNTPRKANPDQEIQSIELSESPDDVHKIIKEGEIKDKKFMAYVDVNGKKVWMCKVCGRSFTQSSNLYCHMRMHTGDKPYQCNVCPKAFRQITHLKDHMRRHTGAKPHKCSACNKCFTQRSAARRHIMVIHGGEAESVRIPESQMAKEIINTLSNERGWLSRGTRKGVLKGRAATPQGGKSCKLPEKENVLHICKVCNKQFPHLLGLNAHSRRCGKHKNWKSSSLKEKCTECGESFTSSTQLLEHQHTCTAQDDEASSAEINRPKKYKGKATSRSGCEGDSVKDNDKRKHQGRKSSGSNNQVSHNSFQCKDCDEVFSSVASLKDHSWEEHSGEMQRICTLCGEGFKRESALRYHQSMKHGKEDRRYKDYSTNYITVKEEPLEVDAEFEEDFLEESESEYEEIENLGCSEDEEEISDVRLKTKFTQKKKISNPETKQEIISRGALKTISNKVGKSTGNSKDPSEDCAEVTESGTYVCGACGLAFTRSSKLKHHKAMWCSGQHETHNAEGKHDSLKENSPSKVIKVNRKTETQRKVDKSNSSEKLSDSSSSTIVQEESSECESDADGPAPTAMDSKGGAEQINLKLHCEDCDKLFPDKHSYDEHLPAHEVDRPFKCEHCPLRFKRKAHMYNHYRRHVSLAGVECL